MDTLDDAEIVDRFLHSQDKAYRVPEVIALIEAVEMKVVEFVPPLLYNPQLYLVDHMLANMISELPRFDGHALAELACGALSRHSFFAVKADNATTHTIALNHPQAIPHLLLSDGPSLANEIAKTGTIEVTAGSMTFKFLLDLIPLLNAALRLIDGKRSLREIHQTAVTQSAQEVSWDTFLNDFSRISRASSLLTLLFW